MTSRDLFSLFRRQSPERRTRCCFFYNHHGSSLCCQGASMPPSGGLRSPILRITSMAKQGSEEEAETGMAEKLAIGAGLVSTPVIARSLYTLKTTGCGLPPGPGGLMGALEGVSYLARMGSRLPNGPFGLLGAVEGLSYPSLVGIVVVFGLEFLERGYIPGPLPADQCFG